MWLAISQAPLAALGAFMTGAAALVAAIAALRKAKQEQRHVDEHECNEMLINLVDRHLGWNEEQLERWRSQRGY